MALKLLLSVIVILSSLRRTVNGQDDVENLIVADEETSLNDDVGTSMYEDENSGNIHGYPDNIVDKILTAYKLAIITGGNSVGEIKLKDIEKEFPLKLKGVQSAKLLAKSGSLRNVLTADRVGPVSIERDLSSRVTINAALGFEILKVRYDRFIISAPIFGDREGRMEVEIRNCKFQVTIDVVPGNPCTKRLTDLEILDFGSFVPKVIDMVYPMFDKIFEVLIDRFLYRLSASSKSVIAQYFYDHVREAVELVDVCKTLSEWSPTPDI